MFDNFGPYHLARLEAASKKETILGIQVNRKSLDYLWNQTPKESPFESVTLNRTNRILPGRIINQQLKQALERFMPECVLVPGWSRSYSHFCQSWCLKNKVPAVVMSETTEQDLKRSPHKEWVKRQLLRGYSAAFVGGSPHSGYLAKLGMSPARIVQGYDVVDNEYFAFGARKARAETNALRERLGLPKKYFLGSARFISRKNLLGLLEAFALYRSIAAPASHRNGKGGANDPCSLVILGDGPLRPELEKFIESRSLGSYVQLPGFRQYDELPIYYGLAQAFIHSSLSEPWGLVVNEAMASGLPVLVSHKCGCARDLVNPGGNGFTFDPEDPGKLAKLMAKLNSNNACLEAMAAASAKRISAWGPERFAAGVLECATVAVRKQRPRPSRWLPCLLKILSNR